MIEGASKADPEHGCFFASYNGTDNCCRRNLFAMKSWRALHHQCYPDLVICCAVGSAILGESIALRQQQSVMCLWDPASFGLSARP